MLTRDADQGSDRTERALIDGDQMGQSEAKEFRTILRTWPALYQMLPAWPSLVDGTGAALPAASQLNTLAGWGGMTNISADLVDRCTAAQPQLASPLSHISGDVQVTILVAVNRDTGIAVGQSSGQPGATVKAEKGVRSCRTG